MIDTHAHLCYYDDNGREIIDNMNDDGLEFIVNIGTSIEDSADGIEIAKENKKIFTTVGLYPEYAQFITDEELQKIEELAKHEKVVAIGEIGLDYHTPGYNREKQIELFEKQLQIADKLNLPFCIHCRKAVEDLYDVLSKNKHLIRHSGLMHCYSEGGEWVQKFVELGMYISFSGNITYKKNDRSFLKNIPLDRIVVETDAPYLTPEPFRGKENQPKNVKYIIETIAKELKLSFEELEKITSDNAKRFYNIGDRK